jgi:hypothetical protein
MKIRDSPWRSKKPSDTPKNLRNRKSVDKNPSHAPKKTFVSFVTSQQEFWGAGCARVRN